jgi:hypothetical protein
MVEIRESCVFIVKCVETLIAWLTMPPTSVNLENLPLRL